MVFHTPALPPPALLPAAVLIWYLSSALETPMWTRAACSYPNLIVLTLLEAVLGQVVAVPMLIFTQHKPWGALTEVVTAWGAWCVAISTAFAVYQLSIHASGSIESDTVTYIVRLTEPLLALLLARVILNDVLPPRGVIYLVVVLTGVALACTTGQDLQFHGIVFTGFTIFSSQIQNVLFKLLQDAEQPESRGAAVAFLISNAFAIPVIGLIQFLVQISYYGFQMSMLFGHFDGHCVVGTVCFVVHQMASYVVLMRVSLPTQTLLNATRMAAIIFTKSLIFHVYIWFQFVGVGVIGLGMYLYIGTLVTVTESKDSAKERSKDAETTSHLIA